MNTLAIDIGGTKFTMAAFENDRMAARETRATDREGGQEWMTRQLANDAPAWVRERRFDRCGIGFGGPVDFRAQRVTLSTHAGGWQGFDLNGFVLDTFGVPSICDNDANLGALGEFAHGAGQGCDPLFYMTLSTGIGGGFIAGGEIYRGADSYAGEIGHLTVRPGGPECLCGAQGCLERMCSGLWLHRDHGVPAIDLLRDPSFVERYVTDLALGLKSCVMLLNPNRIVIGGGISNAGDKLFAPLRSELRRQITQWSRARLDIAPAALGDDSVLYGALELAKRL